MIRNYILKKLLCRAINPSIEEILQYAVSNVEYYKRYNPSKLSSFPVLTKDLVRKNYDELISRHRKKIKYIENTSGGSTGEPVRFLHDNHYLKTNRYNTWNIKSNIGYEPGELMFKIWGEDLSLSMHSLHRNRVMNLIKNVEFFNTFGFSVEDLHCLINRLVNKKPKLVVSYVSAMYEICELLKIESRFINLDCPVVVSAGTLYEDRRIEIEKRLGCKVYNRYGSREVGNIASELPTEKGLVVSPCHYVEILGDNDEVLPPGEQGRIVVTCLTNKIMPLIRYDIGDIGSLLPIVDGKQRLANVSGRSFEFFITKSGCKIHGQHFVTLVYRNKFILKFQFVQHSYDLVELSYVGHKLNDDDIDKIDSGIKMVMGEQCVLKTSQVTEIPCLPSGKHIYTKSYVS